MNGKERQPVNPIPIAFVLPHLKIGGVEHVVLRLMNGLDRNRYRPLLFLKTNTGSLLPELRDDVERADAGGRRAIFSVGALAAWLQKTQPKVVYSGTNAANIMTLAAIKRTPKALRPRLIVSEHTTANEYLSGAKLKMIRKALIRWYYPSADLLVSPMLSLAKEWATLIPEQKQPPIAELPNPIIDPLLVQNLWDADLPREPGQVVTAGRLIHDKGHDILFQAFAQIARDWPDAHLTVYGAGPLESDLLSLISKLDMQKRITLAGVTDQLLRAFAEADIAAFGSRREGFGNVVVEALAMGANVIATECAGPRAILRDGELGQLVKPGDVHSMSEALTQAMVAAKSLQARRDGYSKVMSYTVPAAVDAFSAMIEELIAT